VKGNALSRLIIAGGDVKTPEEGAWDQLWAATGSKVVSGEYYEPVGLSGTRTKKSKDPELGNELWEWTQEELKTWTVWIAGLAIRYLSETRTPTLVWNDIAETIEFDFLIPHVTRSWELTIRKFS
jgi:hypothetical protein